MADRIDELSIRHQKAKWLEQQAIENEKRRRLYAECFGTEAGLRVLEDMLIDSFQFDSTTSKTRDVSSNNEGARVFVLAIQRIIPNIWSMAHSRILNRLEAELYKKPVDQER